MRKKVWILNHYATDMYENKGGRHYWFAENLIRKGYDPTIFCASTLHNSSKEIKIENARYKKDNSDNIPFVFLKTPQYYGNGKKRIFNMISFYRNLLFLAKTYSEEYEKPDIILASSVHPLTLVAGIKLAKIFNIPCICEVRDLWPESIVAYGILKEDSLIAKSLYAGEKWIYKRADSIVMTWEGGKDYIVNKGWDKEIDLNKIEHISNGVVIESFDSNSQQYIIEDKDLDNKEFKNIVYTGSIRKVNNLGLILDAAKIISGKGNKEIKFLIYGSGDEVDMLKKRCMDEKIENLIFKGRVEKKYIPSILKRSYVNLLHNSSTSLDQYGQSQNKFFEYLAAGRSIVQTYRTGYGVCEKYSCGLVAQKQSAQEIARVVLEACEDEELNKLMGENARNAAYDFDFEKLTDKLIDLIEKT